MFQFLGMVAGVCVLLYTYTARQQTDSDHRRLLDCILKYLVPFWAGVFSLPFSSSVLAAFYQQSDAITFEAMSYYKL